MKRSIIALSALALIATQSCSSSKKTAKTTAPKATATTATPAAKEEKMVVQPKSDFNVTETGLEYKFAKDVPGTNMPKTGDYVEVHLVTAIGDSVLFETRQMNNGQPVQFPLQPAAFRGDLVEGLMMMTPGDSAIFQMSVDTLVKAGSPSMPWMKPGTGQKLVYRVAMLSVKTQDQMKTEQEANSVKQKVIDDQAIQAYLAQNKIKATKTASGMYYKIDKPGTGVSPKVGQTVTVNYTGKTMDGVTFDSNVDPQFQHVQPFSFALGQGQVIRGWDEGVALLKKGSKATLYIPSGLAYGANGQGPIKANSVLIFDVEVKDFK
ncbi:MAG: peptidylprolyl isomerase [Sphingobacteriales bacterium]|nr:MAG: peptidylprolyl isomerase [Sphingobacteriales bacterium]